MTHGQGYGSGRAKNLQKSKLLLPCPPFLAGENFLTLQTPLMCLTGYIVTSTLDLRRFIRQLFPERLIQKTTTPPPPFETGTVFAGLRSLLDKCSTKPKQQNLMANLILGQTAIAHNATTKKGKHKFWDGSRNLMARSKLG